MANEKKIPQRKIDEVGDLQEKLSKSSIAMSTSYSKLKVSDMTKLRKELRGKGIDYRVVKNKLAERAAQVAGKPGLSGLMKGPTGLVFGYGEVTEVARTMTGYIRTSRLAMTINGAVMDGKVLKPAEVEALATLPSRTALMGQIAGLIISPALSLARAINSGPYSLALALQARVNQLKEMEAASAVSDPQEKPA